MKKKKTISILKTILPLLLGVFFIVYSVSSATPEERQELWNNIVEADFTWVALSTFMGFLSHFSRAYRWKFLFQPLGYQPKLRNRFMAVMAGYLANLGIPRSGEVLRAASVATYDEIPFEKSFGTIIAERVADLLMLLLILAVTLLFQADKLLPYFEANNINPLFTLILLGGVLILGIIGLKLLQNTNIPLLVKIKNFGKGILEGVKSILNMKHKYAFLAHTLFIWLMYLLMFFVAKYAVSGTAELGIDAILVAFVVGAFAISVTNGGIGIYPIAIGAILLLFGVSKQDGEAFGWVLWGTQTLLNLVLGGLSLVFLPILNPKK